MIHQVDYELNLYLCYRSISATNVETSAAQYKINCASTLIDSRSALFVGAACTVQKLTLQTSPWNRPRTSRVEYIAWESLAWLQRTWALLVRLIPYCEQDINRAATTINSRCQLCRCGSVPALWLWWAQMDGSCSVWTRRIIAHS